jgi:hypothetical protein
MHPFASGDFFSSGTAGASIRTQTLLREQKLPFLGLFMPCALY